MPKITALTANTTPLTTDIMPMVDDPGGTAATQKITIANLRSQLTPHAACGGRLTLTTGVPVTTADVTTATTLYFTPYSGSQFCGQVGLYDGSAKWDVVDFTEISLSLVGYTASKPYDIWVYNNSGTAALDSTVWTDATTRATALTTQNGIYVKTGATTRRYLGTIYINSSGGQTDDSATKRNVWNYYNRVIRRINKEDSTGHTYNTSAYRYWNNDSTHFVEWMIGVVEDAMIPSLRNMSTYENTTGHPRIALTLDGATALDNSLPFGNHNISGDTNAVSLGSTGVYLPSLGRHIFSVMETSLSGSGTNTFNGYKLDVGILG